MHPQYPNNNQRMGYPGQYGYYQQYRQPQQPQQPRPTPTVQKKKLPFHLIQSPICLNIGDTDIHVANFNPEIAIINFWLYSKYDLIFSLFMNVRETEHPTKKCTQRLKSIPSNCFEKHFKISASESDPKENFNVYIEAPIDLDALSEVTSYEEGTVLNSEKYQVIVRLVKIFKYRNRQTLTTVLYDFIIFRLETRMKRDTSNRLWSSRRSKSTTVLSTPKTFLAWRTFSKKTSKVKRTNYALFAAQDKQTF